MTTEKKKIIAVILAAVLVVGVVFSAAASLVTVRAVNELKSAAGLTTGQTQEDDVPIMNGEFWIRSTKNISDAYRSGSTSGLSDKDQETLEMASAVPEEIITEDMTPYEKEKAVYDWMTTALSYDTGVLQVIPQTSEDCDNPYGVLKYHNAVCVGYATTFRLFMQMLDIECMVVHNTELYHSWNLVKLDGEWYHVDIYSDQGDPSYANFNMNDDMASQSHDWDREFFPAATGLQYNYAVQNKQAVEDIYQIPALLRQALEDQQGCTAIGFDAIDEPHAQIVEAMLSSIQSFVDTGEYGPLWMHWNWLHISGSEYVLAVYISGFEQEEPAPDISEEDQQKIEDAISQAFGTDVDWESVEDAMEDAMVFTEEVPAEAVG
ncbi:MAG: transglutaminase domain-containing protein [Evtepia sp.]